MTLDTSVTKSDLIKGLHAIGIKSGDLVLVHSAMRTLGHVEGGARIVVDAFLDAVGQRGTVVAPTFTFKHESQENPVIDPRNDPSEMGAISEEIRNRPEALRSCAFRHSFAAIGRRANWITNVDPVLSPFDLRSSFGVMLALGAKVVLLGVTYSSSTSHHFAEWVSEVPYRYSFVRTVKLRLPDGTVVQQDMTDYQPKPTADGSYYGNRHTDFNCIGRILEQKSMVATAFIGNAAARCFGMRELIDLAVKEAEKDYNVFRTSEGKEHYYTDLDFGTIVMSPELIDGAGRTGRCQWCVKDINKLSLPA
jgi:aminoglycoside 3-N-acetyltransferase